MKINSPAIVSSNIFRFTAGGPTNVQYFKVYGTNVLTTNTASWPLLAVGDFRQTNFDIVMPWTNGGFFYITTNYYDTQNPIPVVFTEVIQPLPEKTNKTTLYVTNTLAMVDPMDTEIFDLDLSYYKTSFRPQIVGDVTNHYTYDWQVEIVGGEYHYANQGMTGYLTPTLAISPNALPDGYDVYFHFVITRLADGYWTEYVLYSHIVHSSLTADQLEPCQQASEACPYPCPCQFAVALPTTEPH